MIVVCMLLHLQLKCTVETPIQLSVSYITNKYANDFSLSFIAGMIKAA